MQPVASLGPALDDYIEELLNEASLTSINAKRFATLFEDVLEHLALNRNPDSYPVYLVQRHIDGLKYDFLWGAWMRRHYAVVVGGHWYQLYKNPKDKSLELDRIPFLKDRPVYGKLVGWTRIEHKDRSELGEVLFVYNRPTVDGMSPQYQRHIYSH